jgi:cytidine deaminase
MTQHYLEIPYKIVRLNTFNETEKALYDAAQAACEKAYAPYSHFSVGCAVLLEEGSIITGSNQENAAYPSGLCAERVALFYAGAIAPEKLVKTIFIYIPRPSGVLAPCGACRQVMIETIYRQKRPFNLYFPQGPEAWIYVEDARVLLPFPFHFPQLM